MENVTKTVMAVLVALTLGACSVKANLVINGNFELGNTGFSSGYEYTSAANGLATGGEPAFNSGEGKYAVDTNPQFYHSAFTSMGDHTSGSGKMMIVNGSTIAGKNVWTGSLSPGLIANQSYVFSAWVMNVYHDGQVGHEDGDIQFSVGNTALGSFSATDLATWHQFSKVFVASASGLLPTAVDLKINYYANDFALDDISITPVPEPATLLAGALLLLPFGASTLRVLRRNRVA